MGRAFPKVPMLPERKQILVVDDELNLRRVLRAQLERDGYDVHTAEDGDQALSLLREHHIDLVITDLRMPKIDGMELLPGSRRWKMRAGVCHRQATANRGRSAETGSFDNHEAFEPRHFAPSC